MKGELRQQRVTFWSVVVYTLYDHKTNEGIGEERNIYSLNEIMWIVHASGHNMY
jgi:hypothetical protein